ncbi:MAG: hypothetical protein NT038_09360 [Euryarchaeota archaeon]|nr:hypothetical protein [Euryarchaeota archaeon]
MIKSGEHLTKTALGLEENIEAALCYLGFWVTGLIFYFVEDKNKAIRFHAAQSVLVFLPLWILGWIFGGFFGIFNYGPGLIFLGWISWVFWALVLILWFVLMFKAYQMEKFKLPIVGDLAEKYA